MNEEEAKALAKQLRQPEGEMGIMVGQRMNEGNQYMNLHTIEKLDPQEGENLLEIGMGNGFFVKEIVSKHPSIKYTGCDFSKLMVEESIKNNQELVTTGRVFFIHTTAESLDFEKDHFDKIFTINTLYFWEDPSKVLAELRRVLKPNGTLFITIRPKNYMQHFGFTKYGFQMYSSEEAKQLLNTCGFKVIDMVEKTDPPIDWFGTQLEPESLIIIAKKVKDS